MQIALVFRDDLLQREHLFFFLHDRKHSSWISHLGVNGRPVPIYSIIGVIRACPSGRGRAIISRLPLESDFVHDHTVCDAPTLTYGFRWRWEDQTFTNERSVNLRQSLLHTNLKIGAASGEAVQRALYKCRDTKWTVRTHLKFSPLIV